MLTGVAALVGIGDATVTGASGDEVESLVAGSFFEDTTFVKTEAGVAQTIDVMQPSNSGAGERPAGQRRVARVCHGQRRGLPVTTAGERARQPDARAERERNDGTASRTLQQLPDDRQRPARVDDVVDQEHRVRSARHP